MTAIFSPSLTWLRWGQLFTCLVLALFFFQFRAMPAAFAWSSQPALAIQEDDPFAEPQDEDDPFAEPQDEEEDPFADPQDDEDDPFAEPKGEDEPMDSGGNVPAEPATDPKPTEPAPPATSDKPEPMVEKKEPEPVTPKPVIEQPATESPDKMNVGNEVPTIPDQPGEKVDTAYIRFRDMIAEMQKNQGELNSLLISMPVGFPEKREAHQARITALRERNAIILNELRPTAIESFDNFPNTQQVITNFLLQDLQYKVTGKDYRRNPFDPIAAKVCYERLLNGGVDTSVLHMLGFQTMYLLNDFDGALESLKKAAAGGAKIDNRLPQDLKEKSKAWQRELEFREQDATRENPQVRIEMDIGDIVAELYEDQAPNTVANFITLAEDGFYNGLEFYLVSPTEFAITGSPTNDGQGGPGYSIASEAGGENMRSHFTGVLTMMRSGQNSVSSRLVITKQPRLHFDGQLPAFGRIIEGLENLYKIEVVNRTRAVPSANEVPTRINRITVLRKRDHQYIPDRMVADPVPGTGG